jgi:iron complex transport system substrate-binding protein
MATESTRRAFLAAAGAAGAAGLLAAGCAPRNRAAGRPIGGAVTIKHAFGETTIPAPPTRVVSAGFTEQDDLLAVGVVPVAITEWFGGQPFAVWPWAQEKLGAAQPVVLTLDNGISIDRIAVLKPDLIVAINAGVDADTYQKLSAIAPTVPQSGGDAFFEPWRDQATAIGAATFQLDAMQSLIASVDDGFAKAGTANPQFKDKKVALLQGTIWQDSIIATMPGWRTDFLTRMGFTVAESIEGYRRDHRAFIPREHASPVLDDADVLIWTTENDAEQAALLADPDIAALRATKQGRSVFTTTDLAGAIAFSSVLSYPLVAERLPPLLVRALG